MAGLKAVDWPQRNLWFSPGKEALPLTETVYTDVYKVEFQSEERCLDCGWHSVLLDKGTLCILLQDRTIILNQEAWQHVRFVDTTLMKGLLKQMYTNISQLESKIYCKLVWESVASNYS